VTPEQFCYWLQGYLSAHDPHAQLTALQVVGEQLRLVLERKELEQTTEVWTTKAHRDHAEILKEYVK
jgi:hypothetical protein